MNPKYRKPPITEAILDLRVEPRSGASAAELLARLSAWHEAYPRRTELPFEQNLPSGANGVEGFSMTFGNLRERTVLGGFRYESADGRRVLQARHNGFVFSFVGTEAERYAGWESFRQEAERLWAQYVRAWQPLAVTRIALRYVNRFPLPSPDSVADTATPPAQAYLQTINIPRADLLTGQTLSAFDLQLVLPQNDIEAVAVINNTMESAPTTQPLPSLLLDIDVFRENVRFAPDDTAVWQTLATLCDRKNQLFRAFITDAVEQTLEPYE